MPQYIKFLLLKSLIILFLISCEEIKNDSDRPNIIVILSDDMGYSDIGAYGGEILTPILDALAENGRRFTQFYNTGRCCPSRASLLTGLYPHQTGIGHMVNDQNLEGYRGTLNDKCVTIAEALKAAGYSNYMSGKWHVTPHPKSTSELDKSNWPLQRGFDKFYGILNGASSFWDPNSLVRDNEQITHVNDSLYRPKETYHLTDAISDNAITFLKEHDGSKPFFMYMAYTAAHWPMHARAKDINKYQGTYNAGYDTIRKHRLEKLKQLGLVDANTTISKTYGSWENVQNESLELELMKTYAAMVDQMDRGLGRLTNTLKEIGQFDNTLILFLQDNGGCHEDLGWMDQSSQGPRGQTPTFLPIPKDSIHYFNSAPRQTRDGWPVLFGNVMPGPADTYLSYNQAWANVSNTPFREYKTRMHEGGIATPLIAHWPNGIASKNELRTEAGHIIDIMATCLDAAGVSYPNTYEGIKTTPLEGKSLLPVFDGKEIHRDFLFWEHEGNRALRMGKWKIVAKDWEGAWELYNMEKDRVELHDLSQEHPEILGKMTAIWEREAHRTKVYPKP